MAKKPTTFTSGALVHIKIGDQILAYAVSVNFSVSKQVIGPPILGEYGVPSLTTTMYNPVSGSIRVLKLAPHDVLRAREEASKANIEAKADTGGGIKAQASTPMSLQNNSDSNSAIGMSENTINMYDPAKVILSTTFDLDIYRAYPSPADPQGVVYQLKTQIVDCRFDSRSVNVPLGQIVNETVSFTGTLLINHSQATPFSANKKILEDHHDIIDPGS